MIASQTPSMPLSQKQPIYMQLPLEIEIGGFLYFKWYDGFYHKVIPHNGTIESKTRLINSIMGKETEVFYDMDVCHLLKEHNHPLYTSLLF